MTNQKEINQELDVTRFVNTDDQPFDIYTNGRLVFHLEPNEEKIMVMYVAQVGAKHLVDRILQKKGIRDTNTDTPLRKDTFAKILPDLAEVIEVKPLTAEERQTQFEIELKKQGELIASIKAEVASTKTEDSRDKKIKELEEKIEQLLSGKEKEEVQKPRRGRPPKTEKVE